MAKSPQTDETTAAPPPPLSGNQGVGLDASREPAGVAVQDARTIELLRLVNGGERQMTEALEQLKAAFKGPPTGASELFGLCIADIKATAQAVRNGAMNHALYLAEQAK